MTHDTTLAVDQGDGPAPPRVEVAGPRFRVWTAKFSTRWLPDTPSNRHLTVVWMRLLGNERGTPLLTLQAWAPSVGRANRQAASQPVEDFRQCGEDCRAFVLRKRKIAASVVDGVLQELQQTPWAGPAELAPRVNAQLGRNDLSAAHIEGALAPIAGVPVRRTLRRQVEVGQVHDQDASLVTEMLESLSRPAPPPGGWSVPGADRGMPIADPTARAALVTPDRPRAQVPGSRCWLTFLMTLFYWHVPLAVLGRWSGVHKTTIVRWVWGLAVAVWPLVAQWIGERVKAHMVYVDEQWLKIRGRWRYWCVVFAVDTAWPVLAALRPSRSQWACRGSGWPRRRLKHVPRGIITDGLPAYAYLVPGAKHGWCRFHHQQGVTHWLQQQFKTDAEISTRKPMMQPVLQTRDTRTVRRRLARLREPAPAFGITPWVSRVEEKLPGRICTVGRVRLPSTTKAIERFCRAFQRFDSTRGGVHAVLSTKRELLRLFVVSLFTPHATTGQAPIEVIMPEARRMPVSRVINDPFRALQERGNVKGPPQMADLLRPQEATA